MASRQTAGHCVLGLSRTVEGKAAAGNFGNKKIAMPQLQEDGFSGNAIACGGQKEQHSNPTLTRKNRQTRDRNDKRETYAI